MGKKVRWSWELVKQHLDSQEDPLVLGSLLVPEGLADPETDKGLVNNQLSP